MGGGGGGGSVRYDNLDKLYGAQSDIAAGTYNKIFAPYAPGAVSNLNAMSQQAMDGTLENQARTQAGNDINVSLGTSANDALRTFGANGAAFDPSTSRGQDTMAQWGLGAAKARAGAMNSASQWAQGQEWGRNFDFYNALAGIPTQSAQSFGSAGAGLTSALNGQRAASAASSAGLGTGLAYMGSKFMKDGGEVNAADGKYIQPVNKNVAQNLWLPAAGSNYLGLSSTGNGQGGNNLTNLAMLGLMGYAGYKNWDKIKDKLGIGGSGDGTTGSAVDNAALNTGILMNGSNLGEAAWNGADAASNVADTASNVADTASSISDLADTAWFNRGGLAERHYNMGAFVRGMAPATIADGNFKPQMPVYAQSSGGGDDLGGLLALANLGAKFFLANGGIARRDFEPGGKVNGPGTETSDSIPARLSDGEYVLNAQAVKQIGKKKLDKMNQRGLQARRAKKGK